MCDTYFHVRYKLDYNKAKQKGKKPLSSYTYVKVLSSTMSTTVVPFSVPFLISVHQKILATMTTCHHWPQVLWKVVLFDVSSQNGTTGVYFLILLYCYSFCSLLLVEFRTFTLTSNPKSYLIPNHFYH